MTKLIGFAALKAKDPARMAEIARQGGKAVPAEKRMFFKDHDLATSAGRLGGQATNGRIRAR